MRWHTLVFVTENQFQKTWGDGNVCGLYDKNFSMASFSGVTDSYNLNTVSNRKFLKKPAYTKHLWLRKYKSSNYIYQGIIEEVKEIPLGFCVGKTTYSFNLTNNPKLKRGSKAEEVGMNDMSDDSSKKRGCFYKLNIQPQDINGYDVIQVGYNV